MFSPSRTLTDPNTTFCSPLFPAHNAVLTRVWMEVHVGITGRSLPSSRIYTENTLLPQALSHSNFSIHLLRIKRFIGLFLGEKHRWNPNIFKLLGYFSRGKFHEFAWGFLPLRISGDLENYFLRHYPKETEFTTSFFSRFCTFLCIQKGNPSAGRPSSSHTRSSLI